jgi:hypothetical protein
MFSKVTITIMVLAIMFATIKNASADETNQVKVTMDRDVYEMMTFIVSNICRNAMIQSKLEKSSSLSDLIKQEGLYEQNTNTNNKRGHIW